MTKPPYSDLELLLKQLSRIDFERYDPEHGRYYWPIAGRMIQTGVAKNGSLIAALMFDGKVFGYSCDGSEPNLVGNVSYGHDFAVVETCDRGEVICDFWAKSCDPFEGVNLTPLDDPSWMRRYRRREYWEENTDRRARTTTGDLIVLTKESIKFIDRLMRVP